MAVVQNLFTAAPGLVNGFVMGSKWILDNSFGSSNSHRPRLSPGSACRCPVRCSASDHDKNNTEEDQISTTYSKGIMRWNGEKLGKIAIAAFATGVLILGPGGDAMAAKSGGRVGGQAFRSAPPPKSAPRSASPRINNSRTNVFINPPVAPPIYGGYGYSTPFFGGWGWSPFSFFFPGPSVAIGVGGGFEIFGLLFVLTLVGSILRSFIRRDDNDDEY
eukprot:Gb_04701 [translate_table: standard]